MKGRLTFASFLAIWSTPALAALAASRSETARGDWAIEVIVNWMPMILLVGVWLFFIRRANLGQPRPWQVEYLKSAPGAHGAG